MRSHPRVLDMIRTFPKAAVWLACVPAITSRPMLPTKWCSSSGAIRSVITWRAPTSWEWPSPLGYGTRHDANDLEDAVVSLSFVDYQAVYHLVSRENPHILHRDSRR